MLHLRRHQRCKSWQPQPGQPTWLLVAVAVRAQCAMLLEAEVKVMPSLRQAPLSSRRRHVVSCFGVGVVGSR